MRKFKILSLLMIPAMIFPTFSMVVQAEEIQPTEPIVSEITEENGIYTVVYDADYVQAELDA